MNLAKYVDTIRSIVGYDIPLSADHQGHFDVNTCIRVGNALERFSLASLEDFLPWNDTEGLKADNRCDQHAYDDR